MGSKYQKFWKLPGDYTLQASVRMSFQGDIIIYGSFDPR